ncbi:MAG: type II secretion system protein [Verrucomicrobiota bacterium]
MSIKPLTADDSFGAKRPCGFTLVELLIVIAIIGVLSSILLPALAKSRDRAQGIFCLNNTRQLTVAWIVYADDHEGKLAYNLANDSQANMEQNWVDNVLSWQLDSDNTNAAALVATGLGPYTSKSAAIYRCPSDHVLSDVQNRAGWSARVRSYSMNGMVGDDGTSASGQNVNNPAYVQFLKYSSFPRPADIFTFVEEHPDSINDGSFLNSAEPTGRQGSYFQWWALPASTHDGAASLSFADGHSEPHRWRSASTKPAARPQGANLPIQLTSKNELQDFYWILSATSVERSDYYHW